MTRLEYALQLAAEGFWLFSIVAGTKKPPHSMHFKEKATRDPETLRHWFSAGEYDIGIYTGRFGDDGALLIVDVDKKVDKDGAASLLQLELAGHELPPTRTHQTPSGGKHLIFKTPEAVKQGVSVLGPGLDIRSRGGYVVAYKGDSYAIADAPAWLVERCGRSDKPKDPTIERAIAFLQGHSPAVEGDGGDLHTYTTACRLKDFGVPRLMAWDLMAEHWNDRCEPPWDLSDLRQKVDNAYGYGTAPPGVADPRQEFSVWVDPSKGKLHFELFDAVQPDLMRRALVKGLLDHGTMSVLYGDSNTGKTFVAMDIGFHIACGRDWHGRRCDCGGVVYVAAEGGGNAKKRVAALRRHYEARGVPFALVPCPIDLGGAGADVEPLKALVAAAEKAMGVKIVLIVIDTLSRAMNGGEENQSKDMTAFVANADKLRNGTGAHVMIVHHSGKDQAKGARGHSSLRAATDTELEVANKTITATKQRDMDAGPKIGFALKVVEIGPDADGGQVTSCVIEPAAAPAEEFQLPRFAQIGLTTFEDLTPNGGKVTLDEWETEFAAKYQGKTPEASTRAFRRAVTALKDAGRVQSDQAFAWVEKK